MCHVRLLCKLQHLGVSGPLLLWFKNYLSGRKQRVVIDGTQSLWADVKSGVPQGSLLGPILFLIYVNDMPDEVKNSHIAMFTDDSKCYKCTTSETDCAALQEDWEDLNALSDWANLNELQSWKLIRRFFQKTPLPLYNVEFCTTHIVLSMFTTTLL